MTQQFHWVQAHTKETRERETGTPTFMAALFTIARARKQPNGHWKMNGEGNGGTHTLWNITQL